MKTFRDKHPARTYTGPVRKDYRSYRNQLAKDFNGRCGYTDCSHVWWGGGFQIDHFAPQNPEITDPEKLKAFAAAATDYNNLIYACPQVNRAKSNDWASDDPSTPIKDDVGYFDPCMDFNEYFERTDGGGIVPKDNPVARYMWSTLKLYLKRYEIYWRMDRLRERLERLQEIRKLKGIPDESQREILEAIADLDEEFQRYFNYLDINYNKIVR